MSIDAYYDKELSEQDAARFEYAMTCCESCKSNLKAYRSLTELVSQGFDQPFQKNLEDRIIEKIHQKTQAVFRWANYLIPATVISVIILIFSWIHGLHSVNSPSAIVSYVSGNISSIVIVETPKKRQTILWIQQENF